jgi:hypothetical protein
VNEGASRAAGLGIIPLAFLVHNAEEAIAIPRMLPQAQAAVTRLLGPRATLPSAREYLVTLAVITAVAFAVWLAAFRFEPLAYALLVLQATMAVNVFSHLAATAVMGGYAPGVVTAVLVEGAVSVVAYRRIKAAGWLSRSQWVLLPILALLLHGPVAAGLALVVLRR